MHPTVEMWAVFEGKGRKTMATLHKKPEKGTDTVGKARAEKGNTSIQG